MRTKKIFSVILTIAVAILICASSSAFAGESKSIPEISAEYRICWFCPLFEKIYTSAGEYAMTGYNAVAEGCRALIAIGLGLWFAFESLKALSQVSAFQPGAFWKKVTGRMFAGVLAIAILSSNAIDVYGYLISPIILAAVGFGSALLPSIGGGQICVPASSTPTYDPNNALPIEAREALGCMMQNMNDAVADAMGWGVALIINSSGQGFLGVLPDIGMLISGIIIAFMFFLLLMVMPIYMVDSVIRLGIVGALLPVFVVAWVFPLTKHFSKAGFTMLINSMVQLITMCLFVGLISAMVGGILYGLDAVNAQDAANDNDVVALYEALSTESMLIFQLGAVALMGFFLISKAPVIGSHFSEMSGAPGLNIAPAVSGAIAQATNAMSGGRLAKMTPAYAALAIGQKLTTGGGLGGVKQSAERLGQKRKQFLTKSGREQLLEERRNRKIEEKNGKRKQSLDQARLNKRTGGIVGLARDNIRGVSRQVKENFLLKGNEKVASNLTKEFDYGITGHAIQNSHDKTIGWILEDQDGFLNGRVDVDANGNKIKETFVDSQKHVFNVREYHENGGGVSLSTDINEDGRMTSNSFDINGNNIEQAVYDGQGALSSRASFGENGALMHFEQFENEKLVLDQEWDAQGEALSQDAENYNYDSQNDDHSESEADSFFSDIKGEINERFDQLLEENDSGAGGFNSSEKFARRERIERQRVRELERIEQEQEQKQERIREKREHKKEVLDREEKLKHEKEEEARRREEEGDE